MGQLSLWMGQFPTLGPHTRTNEVEVTPPGPHSPLTCLRKSVTSQTVVDIQKARYLEDLQDNCEAVIIMFNNIQHLTGEIMIWSKTQEASPNWLRKLGKHTNHVEST